MRKSMEIVFPPHEPEKNKDGQYIIGFEDEIPVEKRNTKKRLIKKTVSNDQDGQIEIDFSEKIKSFPKSEDEPDYYFRYSQKKEDARKREEKEKAEKRKEDIKKIIDIIDNVVIKFRKIIFNYLGEKDPRALKNGDIPKISFNKKDHNYVIGKIYGQAGKIFEKNNYRQTPESYNRYLAGFIYSNYINTKNLIKKGKIDKAQRRLAEIKDPSKSDPKAEYLSNMREYQEVLNIFNKVISNEKN